jgi:CRP-like cAMP-binding protein
VDLEATPQTYPPGVALFGQGDEVEEVFFLIRGFVKLSRVEEDGSVTITGLATDGWLLGGHEAVSGEGFHGTASTLGSCSLVRMTRNRFLARLEEDSDFSLRVHQAQARAFRLAMCHFCVVSRLSVRCRILHFVRDLLSAQERIGRLRQFPSGEYRVELPFRQWELAQFLGTTPEHLSRTLKALGEEGVLSSRKGWLYFRSDVLPAD